MLFDIAAPCALHGLEFAVVDKFDDFGKEGPGSGGGVKYLYFVNFSFFDDRFAFVFSFGDGCALRHDFDFRFRSVSQSVFESKFRFEQFVHRADDEADDGFRCVPDAARFAELRVVLRQEGFVEVDDRVAGFCAFTEVFEQGFDVGGAENIGKVVHGRPDAVVNVRPGDVAEEFSQERIGFRNQFGGFLPTEVVQTGVVQAGSEHAVGQCLGVDVGEGFGFQIVDEDIFEGVVLILQ